MRVLSLIAILFALISCEDETVVSEISGTIYSNCSLQPRSFSEVALKINAGQSFSEPLIIGADQADANGVFVFTYELNESEKGTADLILVQPSGFINLATNLSLQKDYNMALVENNTATLIVNLSGTRTFSQTDTLYLALSSNLIRSEVIGPQNGAIDTLYAEVLNPITTKSAVKLIYGIGASDYQRSLDSLNAGKTYNHLSFELTGCFENDFVDLGIN